MDFNFLNLRYTHKDEAKRFFSSMSPHFMNSGEVDLDRVRHHILQCLAALRCCEQGLGGISENLFYSAVSEASFSLIVPVAPESSSLRNEAIKVFLVNRFAPVNGAVLHGDIYLYGNRDWGRGQWAAMLESLPCDNRKAIIDETQRSNNDSSGNCSSRQSYSFDRQKALLIHYAATSAGKPIDIIRAVSSPAAIRCKDVNGRVPLHWAAMHSRSVSMLDYLLEEWPGATRAPDNGGYTPLHRLVVRQGFPEQLAMVERLIDADPTSCGLLAGRAGYTALHVFCATKKGESDDDANGIFAKLFTTYPGAVSIKDVGGDLPLHAICGCANFPGKASIIKSLLSAYPEGASVMNQCDWLPAHCAAADTEDDEAFEIICEAYPTALSREANMTENILCYAADTSTFMTQYILERNPELARIPDAEERFSLHCAAAWGPVERVELLYVAYPDAIRKFTDVGSLPLHFALRELIDSPLKPRVDVIRYLLQKCPEAVNMRSTAGEVAEAADVGNGEAGAQFREEILFFDEQMTLTPYQLACHRTCEEVQRLFLIACPAADPQRLRELNYNTRRQLMFLAFAARTALVSGEVLSKTEFIYQLRRLMNIGEEMGLLKLIASFL